MNASKLPRGCSPWPPQLAQDRNGTVTFDQSADRLRACSSSSGCSSTCRPRSTRLRINSSSGSVSGPATSSPVLGLRGAFSPMPCWTLRICSGYQVVKNVLRIPPWWVMSRYQSAAPSHGHIAVRCGGCSEATCHWFQA